MRALPVLCAMVPLVAGAQEVDEPPPAAPTVTTARLPPPPGGAASEAERVRWLDKRIDALVAARPALAQAKVGLVLIDAVSGRTLAARGADTLLNVASNTKVVTAAAALALLGPEYRWRTTLLAVGGKPGTDTIDELVLRGGGDPTLDAGALRDLVEELRLAGIKRISRGLVIDDSFFDANTSPPAFDQKQEDAAFRAPVSATSLQYNAVTVRVKPAEQPGAAPTVLFDPASDYLELKNEAITVATGRTTLQISTRPVGKGASARTQVTLSGNIRAAQPGEVAGWEVRRKRIEHPQQFVAASLRAALAARGIKAPGRTRFGALSPAVMRTARVVGVHVSPALTVVLRELGKHSNNFVAEIILKTIGAEVGGAPGTWQKGQAAVRAWIVGRGLPEGAFRYDNGSGLYDSNRFSAAQLARLTRAAALDFRTGADFLSSLAVAGADGTIASRMAGTAAERYVRGKTGTLRGISALTGVAGGSNGRQVVFSVIVNDIPEIADAARAARSLQDEVAQAAVLFVEP